ncbi:hypothetical protein NIES4073_26840 [Kalymmatonema gypsitolerans NIES-4073]|nr:hypothetical protein NIES4073_26840 [Scytonema sp. NIES-4073]
MYNLDFRSPLNPPLKRGEINLKRREIECLSVIVDTHASFLPTRGEKTEEKLFFSVHLWFDFLLSLTLTLLFTEHY